MTRQARSVMCRLVPLVGMVVGFALSTPARADPPTSAEPTRVEVTKLPTCGCCRTWIKYLEAEGFEVSATDVVDMIPVRARAGIPEAVAGCHSATVGGYVIEGHVSAAEIRQLLRDRPPIKGLIVSGMPPGSPGMEGPDPAVRYDVLALQMDGATTVFATHAGAPAPVETLAPTRSVGPGPPASGNPGPQLQPPETPP